MSTVRALIVAVGLILIATEAVAQIPLTGAISGVVRDASGGAIVGAEISSKRQGGRLQQEVRTRADGTFIVPLLPSGHYQLRVRSAGFAEAVLPDVQVLVGRAVQVQATLSVATLHSTITVYSGAAMLGTDRSQRGAALDGEEISRLPLSTRNFMQLGATVAGVSTYLPDNSRIGRGAQVWLVNGARAASNNYQVNGIDANNIVTHSPEFIAVPAPEAVRAMNLQTSLYDASYGHSGGANLDVVTASGSDGFHGAIYEYFRNDALNANVPALKAVGQSRPTLRRNVVGATLGGPLRRNRAFFFLSYQGTHERNGADHGLYTNVLVAPGLTDDRSEATLLRTFQPRLPDSTRASRIDPVALALLNARGADQRLLIPTPEPDGRVSGSVVSTFREEQFNSNFDLRFSGKDGLAAKLFFANAWELQPLGESNVPGFGTSTANNHRVFSLQHTHVFGPHLLNEARAGYSFLHASPTADQPLRDSDLGLQRPTANIYPGLPQITIAGGAGGIIIGSPLVQVVGSTPATTLADNVSLQRGRHGIRLGSEIRRYASNTRQSTFFAGSVDIPTFNDFLVGQTGFTFIGSGLPDRRLRSSDYSLYVQDDWKVRNNLTLNLGVRYEIDLPPYETQGLMGTFDPSLYRPPLLRADGSFGPPAGGILQAGNVGPGYDLPSLPNVGSRIVPVDYNDVGPRLGFAYSPRHRLVLRGGYGIYYSREAFDSTLISAAINPPFFQIAGDFGRPLSSPFPDLPRVDEFPLVFHEGTIGGVAFDSRQRTPYYQHFNFAMQADAGYSIVAEIAWVRTRGANLVRTVPINEARLASVRRPILNAVTGEVITTNTPDNAGLRAPFQGVSTELFQFGQVQTSAQSTYDALQATVLRRNGRVQFSATYTLSKSLDNHSGDGGGPGTPPAQAGNGNANVALLSTPRSNRGLSDFDRTHRLVLAGVWSPPWIGFARNSRWTSALMSGWSFAGIVTAMSGLPADIVDSSAGSIYGIAGGRPNWAPGAGPRDLFRNVPPGYAFNPLALAVPLLSPGQPIPSSGGTAVAGDFASDLGLLGRNLLRGPFQSNVDARLSKQMLRDFRLHGEFAIEFFNLLNERILDNPLSDIEAVPATGGRVDAVSGAVLAGGDFGRTLSTTGSPRIIQLALKLTF